MIIISLIYLLVIFIKFAVYRFVSIIVRSELASAVGVNRTDFYGKADWYLREFSSRECKDDGVFILMEWDKYVIVKHCLAGLSNH